MTQAKAGKSSQDFRALCMCGECVHVRVCENERKRERQSARALVFVK